MDINIIAGKSMEINNKYVFSLLKNRDKTKKHIIIAPDRSLFSLEQRLFEETGESCFFDVNVISMTRFSKTLLSNITNKNILTKQSGVALVKNLLNVEKDNLQTFKKSISYMGFAESLFEMICLYKSCGISPKDVYIDNSSNYFNLKQKDIKLIYEKYEDFLTNNFTDSFNQLNLFAELIDKDFCKNTIFYFVEFDDFTSVMYNIVYKLSRFSDKIYMSCTYSKDSPNSDIYTNKVYYDLIELYKSQGLQFNIIKLDKFNENTKDLLVENLFAYGNYPKVNSDYISIRSLDNINDEVKFVVADIYSMILTNKMTYSDIAIVVPSLEGYKNLIKNELSNYPIPYYIDESEILIDKLIIRNLFTLCNILMGDFLPSDFISLLKSPLFSFDKSSVYDYDNILKRNGSMSFGCINLNYTENEDIKEFLKLIIKLKDKIKEEDTWENFQKIILEILEYFANFYDYYIESLSTIDKRVFNQVLNKLDSINNDFNKVFKNTISTFEEFVSTYQSYFESTTISMPPISSNTLFIADFNSSYVSNYKHIYVLGCNEGKLPKYKLDNGLVTDEEINILPNANKINPTIAMINKRRVFKLFELMFKGIERIHLSYVLSSGDGKQYPNNLINSISKLFNVSTINGSNLLDVLTISNKTLNVDNIVFNNLTEKVAIKNLLNYLKSWNVYSDNLNYRKILSSIYEANKFPSLDNILSKFEEQSKYPNLDNVSLIRKSTSISQIEKFYACPYNHFIKYGLRLKDDIANQFKPNDIGTIIHGVLSKVLPYIMDNLDKTEEILLKAKSYLDNMLSSKEFEDLYKNPKNNYVVKSLYRELDRVFVAVINEIKASNFKPMTNLLEYSFKEGTLKIHGINIKGTIDRIDSYNNDFVIIDYKTGDSSFDGYEDVYCGKKLQLLIYAKAFMNESKLNPVGTFYFPLTNNFGDDNNYMFRGVIDNNDYTIMNMDKGLAEPNYKSSIINLKTTSKGEISKNNYYKFMCLSKEDFKYLIDYAVNKVDDAITNILKGVITPNPLRKGQKSTCDYCQYKGLCNYNGNNEKVSVPIQSIDELKDKGGEDGGI